MIDGPIRAGGQKQVWRATYQGQTYALKTLVANAESAELRQRSSPTVPNDATVVEHSLEFGGGFFALARCKIGLAAKVGGLQAGHTCDEGDLPILKRRGCRLQSAEIQSTIRLVSSRAFPRVLVEAGPCVLVDRRNADRNAESRRRDGF